MKITTLALTFALAASACDTPPEEGAETTQQAAKVIPGQPGPITPGGVPDTTHCTIEARLCYNWCDYAFGSWSALYAAVCREQCYQEFLFCRLSP